jgi:hypothetical protein
MSIPEMIVELWKSAYTLYFPKFGIVKKGEKNVGSAGVDKESKPFRYNFPGKPKKGAKCILIHPDNSAERAHAIDFSEFAEIKTTIGELGNLDIELNDDTAKLEFLKNFTIEITKTKMTLNQKVPPLSFTFNGSKIEIEGDVELKGKLKVSKEVTFEDTLDVDKDITWMKKSKPVKASKHIHPTPTGPSGPGS